KWTSGRGWFPRVSVLPIRLDGICVFASPPCQRLFRLLSSKVHANRKRCHSPCSLQRRPSRRLRRSSLSFVSLIWSSAAVAGPKINFTLKEKLTWQTTCDWDHKFADLEP